MPRHFFVTGTDTEVGKTLVAGALILKLRELNLKANGFKPVAAGTYRNESGITCNEDIETLRLASHFEHDVALLCPYVFDQAIAPHVAAAIQGKPLDKALIMKAFQTLNTQSEAVVVEGAGGFLVPINEQEDLGHIAQMMQLPVILVVGMRLGCINHALLTYEAIRARNLPIAGWVANTLSDEMPYLQESLKTIKNRISSPFLGLIPPLPAHFRKLPNTPYSLKALQFAAQHMRLPE
ncbi:dethiobiotin synthetase [Polynucleobacter meluiroseus]|uniref:ATP-dependent dethiobiotin synthetase BioD n=1 Tax=Polynucleobacter meluiroseus TaxID=1938814 RepID=A0A240E364_9BURK|nr:dethiobiotin synthase [Polynucleobacter meluiroseus]SNX28951.1 dethiobiotin synthetase [Polynucleobacter meluiroseus]